MKKDTCRASLSLTRLLMLFTVLFLVSAALSACTGRYGKAHMHPTVGQELSDLKDARDKGAITEEEYVSLKKALVEAPHAKCPHCKKASCKKVGCKKAGCKKAGCKKGAKYECPHKKAEISGGQCSADACPHVGCTHKECPHKDCPGKRGGVCPMKEKSGAK